VKMEVVCWYLQDNNMNAEHNPDDGIVFQSLKDIFCTIIDHFNAGLCYVTGEFSASNILLPPSYGILFACNVVSLMRPQNVILSFKCSRLRSDCSVGL